MGEIDLYDRLVDLAKRRGFFWPSYEIYGGVAGFYDWGPYGAVLKKNIIDKWRRTFILNHQDFVVELESPVIGPSIVYEASGHVENFTDPIVECLSCGRKFRADHIVEDKLGISTEGLTPEELTRLIREHDIRCPVCGGQLGEVKTFNLLFQTRIGPFEHSLGYVRPELAQGMFVAFKRVYEAMRNKLPLGIAQIGKVGRNEISPRQGLVRLREFTIMEMEFFIDPEEKRCPMLAEKAEVKINILTQEAKKKGEAPKQYSLGEAVEEGVIIHPCLAYWMGVAQEFMESLGVPRENMFFEDKLPEERAHYSSQTFDQLVKVSRWGWIEVAGHSYRGDYDLSRHIKYSGKDLRAHKRLKKPVKRKVRKILINKAAIGKRYRSEAPKVIQLIEKTGLEQVLARIKEEGNIQLEGYEITRDMLFEKEVEETINVKRFVPHVIEPSFGTDRITYVTLEYAVKEKDGRLILSLPWDIAPVKAAVLPLVERDDELRSKARKIFQILTREGIPAIYDDAGSIGRRYARADEIGIPFAVTVDYQTLEDDTLTIRDRDTWRQVRIPSQEVANIIRRAIEENIPPWE